MSHPRTFGAALLAALVAVVSLVIVAPGGAAGPPIPKASNGNKVEVVGTGVPTPTAFAFAGSTVFAGSGPNEQSGGPGGLFALAGGKATKVPNTPPIVFGLAWKSSKLYVSTGPSIVALEGWNGTKFAKIKTIFNAGSTVGGVNGLAWRNGRIYGGGGLVNDIGKNGKVPASPFPDPYSVFSIDPNGKDFQVVAGGLRQPWQLTFVAGNPNPMVSVLSQEVNPIPPDAIVNAEPGKDYGFPGCFAGVGSECAGSDFAQPMITFPKHTSPMGIQGVGDTLYVALFGGIGKSGSEVVRIPAVPNGKPTPVLTGYAAPVVALGISGKKLYTGDIAGDIYLGSL